MDLLTYSDLEILKAKRLRRSGHDARLPTHAVQNNKRYLILTYQGEFDKVHYPLPLPFEEHPDPQDLKKTIVRLRGALPFVGAVATSFLYRKASANSIKQSSDLPLRYLRLERALVCRAACTGRAGASGQRRDLAREPQLASRERQPASGERQPAAAAARG
jgi:coiled-coil domain-containing protein 61